MKNEVLKMLCEYQDRDGFNKGTMRWSDYYFSPKDGVIIAYSKATRRQNKHISEVSREEWSNLSNDRLLWSLQLIIMRSVRQM